jgi:hypothetical protein
MDDFSAWDFAIDFSPTEAAALIVGERPSSLRHLKWEPVIRRMQRAYEWALEYHRDDMNPPSELSGVEYDSQMLQSYAMRYQQGKYLADNKFVGIDFWDWLQHEPSSGFENQVFTRGELTRWLSAIGMKSVYQFDRSKDLTIPTAIVLTDQDIDPADLPVELDAANMAYRAVLNGYGDKSETFKNRLIDYLKGHYTDLKPEAVQRIATVANPDKSAGRKKRDKE